MTKSLQKYKKKMNTANIKTKQRKNCSHNPQMIVIYKNKTKLKKTLLLHNNLEYYGIFWTIR